MGILSKIKKLFKRGAPPPEEPRELPDLQKTVDLLEHTPPAALKFCIKHEDGTYERINPLPGEVVEIKPEESVEVAADAGHSSSDFLDALLLFAEAMAGEMVKRVLRERRQNTNNWRKMHHLPMRRKIKKRRRNGR